MRFTLLGGNAPLLKRQNRAAVLRAILSYGPISRRGLVGATGLTPSTITNIVADLAAAGLVFEPDVPDLFATPQRAGRRQVPVDLAPTGGVAVGVYIGVQETLLAVGGPRAQVIERRVLATHAERGPADLVRRLALCIAQMLQNPRIDRKRVLGVGVGSVGVVDPDAGLMRQTAELGWSDVPLRSMLAAATGLPIVVDSGRRAMALAEMMFGLGRDVRDFALVHVGSTIAAGLVLDHRLQRGATGMAGSLGHTTVAGELTPCHCGKIGCLDTMASEVGIERRAEELATRQPTGLLARELANAPEPVGRHAVYRAGRAGDPDALRILDEAGMYLGRATANMLSVLDLRLVVLSGTAASDFPQFVGAVRDAVAVHAYRIGGAPVEVVPTPFGDDMRLKGALALALHDLFFAPPLVLPSSPPLALPSSPPDLVAS